MIYHDLVKILKDLDWSYKDIQLNMIYNTVSLFTIDYEQGIKIGLKYDRKPSAKKLIAGFREMVKEADGDGKITFICVSLDMFVVNEVNGKKVKDYSKVKDYYQEALQATFRYGFIMPSITACYEDINKYAREVVNLPPRLYELAWVYIFAHGYDCNIPAPEKCTMPEIWANYGILAE